LKANISDIMKIKKRGLRIYRCEKCRKIPAMQIIHYQRRNSLLNDDLCLCDRKDPCSWGFFNKYFKDDTKVQKILEKHSKGLNQRG